MAESVNPNTRLDEKRMIPQPIQKLLEWDVKATKRLIAFLLNFKVIEQFKRHCKFLEWSCHGLIWLVGWAAFCYMFDNKELYQTQVNLLLGLVIDIIIVALIKAAIRRRRPTVDDNPFSFGPDKFSFPSGHASRAVFIFCFFTCLSPLSILFLPPLFAWVTAVCFSRLILFRHHILDVVAGIALGVFEGLLLSVLWCDQNTSTWLINWMTDEKISGPEYDV